MPRRMPSRKNVPDEEVEEQRPAKVPRIDGSESKDLDSHLRDLFKLPDATSRTLQDRVKVKVQQLVAAAELENTTIGSLRRNLEDELGLAPDSLLSTKRLRKFIHQVLEQEVLKKTQRSSKCDRICAMLARMERYPANCRKMLIDALPGAMADPEGGPGGGQPHPHQVRILETVAMALQDDVEYTKVQIESVEERIQTEKVKVTEYKQAHEVVVASSAEVVAEFEAQEKLAKVAEEACADAKAELLNTKRLHEEAKEGRPKLMTDKETCNAFLECYRRLQEESVHVAGREADKDKLLDEVKQGLEALGTQESLVIAGLLALKKSPTERSRFEEAAAQEILKVFRERSEKIDEELSTNSLLSEDGLVLAAEALFDAMLQNAAKKVLVAVEAREAKNKKEAELDAAKKTVAKQAKVLRSCEEEHTDLKAKVVDMSEVLHLVQKLTVCVDVATSPEKLQRTGEDDDNESEAHRIYSGTFFHPDLGKDEIPIRVILYTPTQGKWTAYDQTDQISVVCEGDKIRFMDSTTELEGKDVGNGVVRGVVIQAGTRGGEFELQVEASVSEDTQEGVQPSNLDGLFHAAFESSNMEVEKSPASKSQHTAEEPALAEQSPDALQEEDASTLLVEPATLVEATSQKVETTDANARPPTQKLETATQAPVNNEAGVEVATANGGA